MVDMLNFIRSEMLFFMYEHYFWKRVKEGEQDIAIKKWEWIKMMCINTQRTDRVTLQPSSANVDFLLYPLRTKFSGIKESLCLSVGRSVGRSVCLSVCLTVQIRVRALTSICSDIWHMGPSPWDNVFHDFIRYDADLWGLIYRGHIYRVLTWLRVRTTFFYNHTMTDTYMYHMRRFVT